MVVASFGLPPPEPLQLQQGNTAQKWKKFKQTWSNYEIATGVAKKEKPTRVATLLTVIGEEAVDVYNTFTWDEEGDDLKSKKSWRSSRPFATPGRTLYMNTVFFSRNQDSGESIDHYVTVLKNVANTCEFGALKESLIRDRIVFGIQDSSVRERLLRDAKLTLETAIEKVRSSKLTQIQLKQIKADKTTDESISAITTEKPPEKLPSKFPMIDYKFCGRRHPRNKNLCPAYGSKCQKCGLANHFAKKCQTKEINSQEQGNNSIW